MEGFALALGQHYAPSDLPGMLGKPNAGPSEAFPRPWNCQYFAHAKFPDRVILCPSEVSGGTWRSYPAEVQGRTNSSRPLFQARVDVSPFRFCPRIFLLLPSGPNELNANPGWLQAGAIRAFARVTISAVNTKLKSSDGISRGRDARPAAGGGLRLNKRVLQRALGIACARLPNAQTAPGRMETPA